MSIDVHLSGSRLAVQRGILWLLASMGDNPAGITPSATLCGGCLCADEPRLRAVAELIGRGWCDDRGTDHQVVLTLTPRGRQVADAMRDAYRALLAASTVIERLQLQAEANHHGAELPAW